MDNLAKWMHETTATGTIYIGQSEKGVVRKGIA